MRGSLLQAKKDRAGLPKGEHTWNIVLALGRGADGKYKQKWVRFHGTKKQAEQKLTQLVGDVHKGDFIEPSKARFDAWLDNWLDKAVRPPRRSVSTYALYKYVIEKHLRPSLGHIPLQQLTALQVERYYADKAVSLSERSMALHRAVLTTSLNAAVRAGVVHRNVAIQATNRPRIPGAGEDVLHNVWTADEARRFLAKVKEGGNAQNMALFALALDTGMRKSELLALQWQDLDGGTLKIERQLLGWHEDPETKKVLLDTSLPKGRRARSMELSDETMLLLKEHRKQQAELKLKNRLHYADYKLIFAQEWEDMRARHAVLGRPLQKAAVGRLLARFATAAGVKKIKVHGLRHTCATLLLSVGVPANVVQRRLGHTNVALTLNIYSHVLPSMQQDAASRLASLLHG